MPSPSCESIQQFMNEYDKYCAACSYAAQWLQAIKDRCLCLQENENYDTALDAEERADIEANYTAAQGCTIIPQVAPPNVPNPPGL